MKFTKHCIERAKTRTKRKTSTQVKAIQRMKNKMKNIIITKEKDGSTYAFTSPNPNGFSLCYIIKEDKVITTYWVKLNEKLKQFKDS